MHKGFYLICNLNAILCFVRYTITSGCSLQIAGNICEIVSTLPRLATKLVFKLHNFLD